MSHAGHTEDHNMEGQGVKGPDGSFPVGSLLENFPRMQQNQLLEMLHMPLLHGGVREVLLLASLTTTSPASFALACLVLALSAALLDLLRLLLWWVEGQYTSGVDGRPPPAPACQCKQCTCWSNSESKEYKAIHDDHHHSLTPSTPTSMSTSTSPLTHKITPDLGAIRHVCYACAGVLHLLTYLASTLLMLVAMTMNVYLILAIGIGSALGRLASLTVKRKLLEASCK